MSNTTTVKDTEMVAIAKRVVSLPLEKRTVFEQALKNKGIDMWDLPIVARPRTSESFPLSFAQERLWVVDQLDSGSSRYNLFFGIRFDGPLNLDALERSINEIIRRHEVLRSTVVNLDGHGHQRIQAFSPFTLPLIDARQSDPPMSEHRLKDIARTQSSTSFDLFNESAVRIQLVRPEETEHILMVTIHHMAFDAWSVPLITNELRTLYDAFAHGGCSPLDDLPIQYVDFACWQREWLESQGGEGQWTYWKEQLQNVPVPVTLPFDRTPPPIRSFEGGAERLRLSEALSHRIYALCRRSGVTLYMMMLAVYQILLSRYSGNDDICVGTSIANRSRPETEPLIGFLVNTLVMRTRLDGDPSVLELLRRVRDVVSGALAHQDLPFEKLVELLDVPRKLNVNPLFQVFFVLVNVSEEDLRIADVTLEPFEVEDRQVHFDLTLRIGEEDEQKRIHCEIQYARELFEASTAIQLLKHYQNLLEAAVACPDARLSELSMMSAEEREDVRGRWTHTQRAYPQDTCIHELFEAQVQTNPDAESVRYEGETLTYQQLDSRANQLANHLRGLGVGPEVRVGLCLERSLDLIVGLLAVIKAGGVYVPLDPKLPQARLLYMLADSEARVVLTQTHWNEAFAESRMNCVCVDRDWAEISGLSDRPVVSGVSPNNLVYVIYTSGSTGRPKGVAVQHQQLVNYVNGALDCLSLEGHLSFATVSTVGADLGNTSIFGALCSGQMLHILATDRGFDPDAMAEYMHSHHVDVLKITPTHLLGLLEAAKPEWVLPRRCLILGGEAVRMDLIDRVRGLSPDCEIVNHYGPTEATVGVLIWKLDEASERRTLMPIGQPLPNIQSYILDETGEPTPTCVPGELYIGGKSVTCGYLQCPELTAECFVPDPFSRQPGKRLYKTGDQARYLPNGLIEFLGRTDTQVKLRGFRIELGEIDAHLRREPEITDAVTVVRESTNGIPQLVAYVVEERHVDLAALRLRLEQDLPEYMVPSSIIILSSLPLTSNGKLDRTALPDPEEPEELRGRNNEYVAPRNPAEQTLSKIWAGVLLREQIGIHDNFFELGGDSILTLQVIARARQQGLKVTPKQMFDHATIAQLAAVAGSAGHKVEVPPNGIPADCDAITPAMLPLVELTPDEIAHIVRAVSGGAGNIQDIYPLAPLQEGIVFHHLMQQTGDAYVMWTQLRFDTQEQLYGFIGALQAVIERHDLLRTAVWWEGLHEPVQVVWKEAPVVFEELRFEEETGDVGEQLRLRYDPGHYRIDVREAPLIEGGMAQDSATGQWLLQLVWHHLIGDHLTMGILVEEIQAILLGQGPNLATPLPFRNFIAYTRQGVSSAQHKAFFTKMLGEVNEPTTPFGLQDVYGDGSGVEVAKRVIESRMVARVRECARRLEVSVASLIHLAWAQVLARVSARHKVVFGTVLMGRMSGDEGADRIAGQFMNILPIRIDVGKQGVADSVRETHIILTRLLQHEYASLVLAQRCSGVAAPAPLFVAFLNYRHNREIEAEDLADDELVWKGIEQLRGEDRTNYPVGLDVDDWGETLGLTASVALPGQAYRVCDYMQTALEHLVAALETTPELPVNQMKILPVSERQQMLEEWNATDHVWDQQNQCVPQLFEAQVKRTPQAVAVTCKGQALNYDDLNRRSNQVAQALLAEGVGPETLVGVFGERDSHFLTMLLGVLKSGGAYLPLDTKYPDLRISQMIEQSQSSLILTSACLAERVSQVVAQPGLEHEPKVFTIEALLDGEWSDSNSLVDCLPEQLAYVIYTSGSTGIPKGAMVTHAGLMNQLLGKITTLTLSQRDCVAQTASQGFDISVWQFLTPLLCGGRVEILPDTIAENPTALLSALEQEGITIWETVPALLQGVLDVIANFDSVRPTLVQVRWVLPTGEALPSSVCQHWFTQYPNIPLMNAYGPAECADDVAVHTMTALPDEQMGLVPIGRPVPNTQLYVLSPLLEPAPIGVAGELCVAGVGVGRGYVNDSQQTAASFIPNPYSQQVGQRLYKTGDLARYRPDGILEYLGRMDHQVKLRGFRIELEEIETHLLNQPTVQEVVVAMWDEGPGGSRLVAYYRVATGQAAPTTAEWRSLLREQLPQYMIPSVFMELPVLPRTPNGKVDRAALPIPEVSAEAARQFVAPRMPMEKVLAGIWAEVLRVEKVGIHDNFFDLGGHSLLAVQLLHQIQKTIGRDLSLMTIFQSSTIASLSEVVMDVLRIPSSPLIALKAQGSRRPLYCIDSSGNHVFAYQPLAQALDTEQPVYGIELHNIFTLAPKEISIAVLAKEYAKEIVQHQPEGPYHLLGWSLGGVIALAIAHALEELEQNVAFLGFLDTQTRLALYENATPSLLEELAAFLRPEERNKLLALPDEERQDLQDRLQTLNTDEQVDTIILWAQEQGLFEADISVEVIKGRYALLKDAALLMKTYRSQPIQAPVYVWWAETTLERESGIPPIDWSCYTTGNVHRENIESDHEGLLTNPQVHQQIDVILAELDHSSISKVQE